MDRKSIKHFMMGNVKYPKWEKRREKDVGPKKEKNICVQVFFAEVESKRVPIYVTESRNGSGRGSSESGRGPIKVPTCSPCTKQREESKERTWQSWCILH